MESPAVSNQNGTFPGWTTDELNEVLYHWDNTSFPIHEYKSTIIKNDESIGGGDIAPVDTNEETISTIPSYLNITIDEDDIHIVEFYAPWCPHCQHFKPAYIQLAKEVTERIINANIYFHSVSCTLNEDTCISYDIQGYPTFLGYRGGGRHKVQNEEAVDDDDNIISFPTLVGSTLLRGIQLNLGYDLNENIDLIATMMKFDLASIPRNYSKPESKFSNSEDQRKWDAEKVERSKEVAEEKLMLLEAEVSKNQIYHDAILSFTYILQNGIGKLSSNNDVAALREFLRLVDWATPLSWPSRKTLVKDLIDHFESQVIQGKTHLNNLVERHFNDKENSQMLWGHIDNEESQRRKWQKRRSSKHIHSYNNGIDKKKWTQACSRGPTSQGFTCGLWELLHIVTIGSGMIQNQLYGFHHGYFISQRDVSDTIRNFINQFFRCDICRTNFVAMYDNCGHNHCTRLSYDSPFVERSQKVNFLSRSKRIEDQHEVAIWLWEVHNSVNVRLLKEQAQRERRNFTKAEELAAKFPSRKRCPACWFDREMNEFDSFEVYTFLKGHYWPSSNLPWQSNGRGKQIHGEMSIEGEPLSTFGFYCTLAPFVIMICIFVKQFGLNRFWLSLFPSQTSKNKSF